MIAWVTGLGLAGAAAAVDVRVDYVQLEDGAGCVTDVVLADVDGDGARDLVLATGTCEDGPQVDRSLQVHLRQPGARSFANAPTRQLTLVRDVVAFAVLDVHSDPGREIVLFSPARAVAVHGWASADEPSYTSLFELRFLWQPADPLEAFAWQAGVQDLDGDGHDDLWIPEPNGYRIALQRRTPTEVRFEVSELELPPIPIEEDRRNAARFTQQESDFLTFGSNAGRPPRWIRRHDELPTPRCIDWDGDGRRDFVALCGRKLVVWKQSETAKFRYHAGHELPERRTALLSPSYSVELADLDADRRADVILVSGRTEGDDVTSLVEVFLQANGPGYERQADDKLRLQGFVDAPRCDDVDGDGRPDLAIGSLRPDLIGALSSGGADGVEAQLNLFINRFTGDKPRFQRPVALVHKVRLPSDVGEGWRVIARFFRDLDGDGRRDLLLRTGKDRVEAVRTIERGRGLGIGDPLWGLDIAEHASAWLVDGDRTVLLVREPTQVVHVEFR